MENKELETWLSETKAKNLSLDELESFIEFVPTCPHSTVWSKLKGETNEEKAQILFNQWQKETEFSPKRGDRVLVLIGDNKYEERIFLQKLEGANCQFLVVAEYNEKEYLENKPFDHYAYSNMKPLPTENPTETDCKSKVIELVEGKIEHYKSCEIDHLQNGDDHDAIEYRAIKNQFSEFLEEIKQLC